MDYECFIREHFLKIACSQTKSFFIFQQLTPVVNLAAYVNFCIVFCYKVVNFGRMLLKFWVSGRGLLDKSIPGSTTDPYYIVFLSEDGGKTKTEIGRSDTITNQLNPDWTNVFEIKIDRTKNQYLYFYVLDKNCNPEDPHITLGRVWLNVDDYVKKGQNDSPNLDKAGCLIITNADGAVGSGMLRMPYGPYGTPDKQTLKFKISAKGLPTAGDVGFISMKGDLGVVLSVREGPSGPTKEVGRTNTVPSSRDISWIDVLTIDWIQDKDQRLQIKICDDDLLHSDHCLGQVWMQLNDYVAKEELHTVLLPTKGSITIRKA